MKKIIYLLFLFPLILNAQRNYLEEGNSLLSQNKNKEAEEVFREGLKTDEENLVYQTQIGLCLLNQGKYDEAQKELDKVISIDSKNIPALWYAGINNFKNKNFRKAIEYFEKAYPLIAKTSPQFYGVNFFIAKSYRNLLATEGITYQETDRMLETSKEYVRLQPNASDVDSFLEFIEYVEESRPPANVKKWIVSNEKNLKEVLKKQTEKK